MDAYTKRLINERIQLNSRLENLKKFRSSPIYDKLPSNRKNDLRSQESHMLNYLFMLDKRLVEMKIKDINKFTEFNFVTALMYLSQGRKVSRKSDFDRIYKKIDNDFYDISDSDNPIKLDSINVNDINADDWVLRT